MAKSENMTWNTQFRPKSRQRRVCETLDLLTNFLFFIVSNFSSPLYPPGECHCNMGVLGSPRKILRNCYKNF